MAGLADATARSAVPQLYPSEQRTLFGSLISWWTGVMSEAGAVRRRRSRAEVEALVAEFEASGLMREAFCRQRDLAVATLDKYRRRVGDGDWRGGRLLAVELVSSSRNSDGGNLLVVELRSGRRIEVRQGFDAGMLERLLTVLDRA